MSLKISVKDYGLLKQAFCTGRIAEGIYLPHRLKEDLDIMVKACIRERTMVDHAGNELGICWKEITIGNGCNPRFKAFVDYFLKASAFDLYSDNIVMSKAQRIVLYTQYFRGALTLVMIDTKLDHSASNSGYAECVKYKADCFDVQGEAVIRGAVASLETSFAQSNATAAQITDNRLKTSLCGVPKNEQDVKTGDWVLLGGSNPLDGDLKMPEEVLEELEHASLPVEVRSDLINMTIEPTPEDGEGWDNKTLEVKESTMCDEDIKLDEMKEHSDPTVSKLINAAEEEADIINGKALYVGDNERNISNLVAQHQGRHEDVVRNKRMSDYTEEENDVFLNAIKSAKQKPETKTFGDALNNRNNLSVPAEQNDTAPQIKMYNPLASKSDEVDMTDYLTGSNLSHAPLYNGDSGSLPASISTPDVSVLSSLPADMSLLDGDLPEPLSPGLATLADIGSSFDGDDDESEIERMLCGGAVLSDIAEFFDEGEDRLYEGVTEANSAINRSSKPGTDIDVKSITDEVFGKEEELITDTTIPVVSASDVEEARAIEDHMENEAPVEVSDSLRSILETNPDELTNKLDDAELFEEVVFEDEDSSDLKDRMNDLLMGTVDLLNEQLENGPNEQVEGEALASDPFEVCVFATELAAKVCYGTAVGDGKDLTPSKQYPVKLKSGGWILVDRHDIPAVYFDGYLAPVPINNKLNYQRENINYHSRGIDLGYETNLIKYLKSLLGVNYVVGSTTGDMVKEEESQVHSLDPTDFELRYFDAEGKVFNCFVATVEPSDVEAVKTGKAFAGYYTELAQLRLQNEHVDALVAEFDLANKHNTKEVMDKVFAQK